MSTQYDVKYVTGATVHRSRMGVIIGSDAYGATAKDVANLARAEDFFRVQAIGQFVRVSDDQRRVNGEPISISGHAVRKESVKEGETWHHTLYVR